MSTYRLILKQAWKITLKNKALWFFGFFASLISFGAELKILSQVINQNSGIKTINQIKMFFNTGLFSKDAFLNFLELIKNEPKLAISFILFLLFILALSLFFIWLATVSQISIVNSVKRIIKKGEEKIIIKKEIEKANKNFWPVLGMNVIAWLIINAVIIFISLLLILSIIQEKSWIIFLYGALFIIFIPIILIISFIIKYAIAYIIIDGKKFKPAITSAWKLFKNNWLVSVELAITLFFINILVIFIGSFLILLLISIFMGMAVSLSVILFSSKSFFWLLLVLGLIIVVVLTFVIGAMLNTFQISAWTDLFIKIKTNKPEVKVKSKLERIFEENNK